MYILFHPKRIIYESIQKGLLLRRTFTNEAVWTRGEAGEAADHKAVCTRGLVRAVGRKNLINLFNKEPLLTCVNKEPLLKFENFL